MAQSAGEIGLDLVVNQKEFNKQMAGVTNLAKKAGVALAAAFSAKKLVDFGKSCLDLGSDLAEVQNVVDVTFPNMSKKVDEFAKSAITASGLSETMSKQFIGTFGSMAKAFGFSEKQAYDMGTSLTSLAGDVASFYNISQDAAYTKLKSVFTGETESLKDLGVVMTQTALDSYAMANGFGKTTQQMSEAEKVALRYQFVATQLSAAQGDFARTSGGFANQVRILKLQFDSLKATIGQGLINLFTPIIRVVNALIGKLATLANAFKSFTELLTGNKSSGTSQISDMGSAAMDAGAGMENASDAAEDMSKSNNKVANTAKKAAKEMRALMGFDKINKLDNPADEGDASTPTAGGSGAGAGGLGDAVNFGGLAEGETVIDKVDKKMSSLMKRCKELSGLFKKGFKIGFGDSEKKIESINKSLKNIGVTAREIFNDTKVVEAANQWLDSVALNFGKVSGSVASIGISIADNLIGGFDKYLSGRKDYIKQRIISLFNVRAEINNLVGDFAVAIADIAGVLSGDSAKGITADIIGIFSDGFLGVLDIGQQFTRDLIAIVVTPVVENVDKIKIAFENTLVPIKIVLDTLYSAVQQTFEQIFEVYNNSIKPFLDSLSQGISEILGVFLNAYNTYIAPILEELAVRFDTVWNEHIQPALNKLIELFGNIIQLLQVIWENILVPFIEWIIKNISPVVGKVVKEVGIFLLDLFGAVSDIFGDILDILNGFVEFLIGAFTGDNQRTWEGIRQIMDGFSAFLRDTFGKNWEEQFGIFGKVIDTFFKTVSDVWSGVKRTLNGIIEFVQGTFTGNWEQAWQGIQDIFGGIFDGLVGLAKSPLNLVIDLVNSLIEKLNSGLSAIERAFSFDYDFKNPITGNRHWGHYGLSLGRVGQIPHLAQGGFVEKNTPQLAMIGDNRHQGEVVAPEDKLREMALEAVKAAGTSGITRDELERIINSAVMRIVAALSEMGFYLDSTQVARATRNAQQAIDLRYNTAEVG